MTRHDRHRADARSTDRTDRTVSWWLLLLVGFGVALWCAPGTAARATAGERLTADEPQYVLTAISLGEDLDLDISDERAAARYRDFNDVPLPLQEKIRDDGRLVSPHDPLLPAILAVPVLIGGWIGAKFALAALAGVLAAAMVWVAVVRLRLPLAAALVTVLAFAAGAPLAMYATQVYPEFAGRARGHARDRRALGPAAPPRPRRRGRVHRRVAVAVGEVRTDRGDARAARRVAVLARRRSPRRVLVRRRARRCRRGVRGPAPGLVRRLDRVRQR